MTWRASHDGSTGRPAGFSDAAIQFCLTIKVLFKRPQRATRPNDRAFRKRWTGFRSRRRIEAKMRGLKGSADRIAARDPDRKTAEIQISVALINRFNALGTADFVRVA